MFFFPPPQPLLSGALFVDYRTVKIKARCKLAMIWCFLSQARIL